jgi:hypothetical protein
LLDSPLNIRHRQTNIHERAIHLQPFSFPFATTIANGTRDMLFTVSIQMLFQITSSRASSGVFLGASFVRDIRTVDIERIE